MFYFQFVVILAGVCHICAFLLKKLSRYSVKLLNNGCEHLSVVRIGTQVKTRQRLQQKNIHAKFFACELWVKRVGTFGVVLYRNQ